MPAGAADPTSRPRRPALRGQGGFALIEALASAAVLAIVALGVLAGVDAAAGVSGREKVRATAAALAERDQERMRSIGVQQLAANFEETQTVTLEGTAYAVASRADWLRDESSAAEGCSAAATSQGDYLRITSEVTGGRLSEPVRLSSLVAIPVGAFGRNTGTLSVKVTDRDGAPRAGVAVRIAGPGSYQDVTNDAGCAVFARIPVGTYSATAEQAGNVDPSGAATAVLPAAGVTANAVNVVSLSYDRRAVLRVAASTQVPAGTEKPDPSQGFTVVHAGIPTTGTRTFTGDVADGLFPFPTPYTVYAGTCAEQDPALAIPTYWSTGGWSSTTMLPGEDRATPLPVREPALNLNVTWGSATLPTASRPDVRVVVTLRSSATPPCTARYVFTAAAGQVAYGALTEPGIPFGSYDVCVEASGRAQTITSIANTAIGGTSTRNFPMSSASAGSCP